MPVGTVLVYTVPAGLAIPLGGLLAYRERIHGEALRQDVYHAMIAFGGGLLLAAVALVLVPQGVQGTGPVGMVIAFAGGSVAFLLLDRFFERRGDRMGQVLAMAMDDIPEAIGLGAAFSLASPAGPLLAILVGLQNLPQGFNAYRDVVEGWGHARTFAVLVPLSLMSPIAGAAGYVLLAGHATIVAWIFLFAAGGILYGVFHDIAPLAHRDGHWLSTLGTSLGFVVGLVTQAAVG